ncbi:bifunctional DNA primase/polymerase [Streptococcus agalactiae]|uniref:bifunctional DNA primase/polymerase n=1 Tax=Streptococcus agalactiae TaxID=1311 RepID=UPI0039C730D5
MKSMKDYALAYQKLGFSVLPISLNKKTPMIQFRDKPPMTAEEIEKFWSNNPNANIALKTDKFFVIDIDIHGSNGFESMKHWEGTQYITPTLQAKTASGGKHIFYFKKEGFSMTQNIGMLPGVDIKAHPNNYVLVAPSATEKGQYEWDIEKSSESGTITTATPELLNAINALNKKSELDGIKYRRKHDQGEKTRTTALFETIATGFGGEGGRNDALASFVGGLLLRNVDDEFIYTLAKIANENGVDPLDDREVQRTVESMIETDRR